MKISKSQALELIDQKIRQFKVVLNNSNYDNRYDETYQRAFDGAETLISKMFSSDTARDFKFVTCSFFAGGCSPLRELEEYKEHLRGCIAQLELCKKHISAFWKDDVPRSVLSQEKLIGEEKPSLIHCPVCGKTFKTDTEMETHRDTIHYELHE